MLIVGVGIKNGDTTHQKEGGAKSTSWSQASLKKLE